MRFRSILSGRGDGGGGGENERCVSEGRMEWGLSRERLVQARPQAARGRSHFQVAQPEQMTTFPRQVSAPHRQPPVSSPLARTKFAQLHRTQAKSDPLGVSFISANVAWDRKL